MYESIHSYEPAFYMSGALTFLAICLLFLVQFFIPPDVQQEWTEKTAKKEAVHLENAPDDHGREKRPLASKCSSIEGHLQVSDELLEDYRGTFASSIENIVEKYCSMPKLVAWEDCVSRKLLVNSMEHQRAVLDACRETSV